MNSKNTVYNKYPKVLGLLLAVGLTFDLAAVPASAKEQNTYLENHIITREQAGNGGPFGRGMVDANGDPYTDPNAGRAASSLPAKKAAALPAQYDLRSQQLVTPIKDQGYSGCCWAFSAIKAIESNGLKTGLLTPQTADFSENHLAWFSYSISDDPNDPLRGDGIQITGTDIGGDLPNPFSVSKGSTLTYPYDNGGSAPLANFTLARWSGLELEANAPFSAASPQSIEKMANEMLNKNNSRYSSYAHLQQALSFDEYLVGDQLYITNMNSIIPQMKQAVMDYGAMSIALYFNKKYVHKSSNGTSYYQTDYSGKDAVKNANHCITVVGWDDNFSRNNFSSRPAGDGAWLVANSYGTEFGEDGYFWLSYYDPSICDCYSFLAEPASNYQSIYQYDGFGWNNANFSKKGNIRSANIFTADADAPQEIRAVSFYTLTDNQPYKIQIYRGVKGSPTNGVLVKDSVLSGVMEHNGYHTVSLTVPVNVNAGEKFSVVITYIQSGGQTIYVPFEGTTAYGSSITMHYGSKPGQSFLYTKAKKNSGKKWYDTSVLGYNNTNIKAFSNDAASAGPLPRSGKTYTIGKGETLPLSGSYSSYASNDTAIADVSPGGTVIAKRLGTTKITCSDGAENTTVTIRVKKAPSRIRISPSGKKKIKKGRSFRLKVKLPSGSASRRIRFHSSRGKIASVSASGRVKARRRGTAVITAKTYNGKKARLKVHVW